MKIFVLLLTCLTLSLPAHANEMRLEEAAEQTYKDLLEGKFEDVEKRLDGYMSKNVKTRHGRDKTLSVMDAVLNLIDDNRAHTKWTNVETQWKKEFPSSFTRQFFNQQYKHSEALYFVKNAEEYKLLQSELRRYKDTMGRSYSHFLEISNDHPNQWRTHAYLAENFDRYKLTAAELNSHFRAAQQLNKGEVSSIKGYVTSLSPYALGRDDEIIAKGIESILKKYPDRNLSKPEYIDDQIKKEIEDQIFEFTIGRMLLTARKYVEEAPSGYATSSLIPIVYEIIFKDLERYYGAKSEKAAQHPLSYKRKAVWHEIEEHYKRLAKDFPNSGEYLSSYLKLTLDQGRLDDAKTIIATLQKNDPNYAPQITAPLKCNYYARIKGSERNKSTNAQMYKSCKKASFHINTKTFNYRAGWAARQIGNFEESNIYMQKALKIAPENPIYLTDICWNYKDLKQYDKALDYCDKAIAKDRENARAWLGRSHINFHGFNNVAQSQKDAQIYKRLTDEK